MTTYTASAAAPGYRWRRQAPLLSALSPLADRSEPVLRNKQIFVRRASGAAPLRAPLPSPHEPLLRNKPILGHSRPATNPHYETNPFSAQPKLLDCGAQPGISPWAKVRFARRQASLVESLPSSVMYPV